MTLTFNISQPHLENILRRADEKYALALYKLHAVRRDMIARGLMGIYFRADTNFTPQGFTPPMMPSVKEYLGEVTMDHLWNLAIRRLITLSTSESKSGVPLSLQSQTVTFHSTQTHTYRSGASHGMRGLSANARRFRCANWSVVRVQCCRRLLISRKM